VPRRHGAELWTKTVVDDPDNFKSYYEELYQIGAVPDLQTQIYYLPEALKVWSYMLLADQNYSALMESRRQAIVRLQYHINPAVGHGHPQYALAEEIAHFIEDNIAHLPDFNQDIYELTSALPMGFAVSEIIWERHDGRWWFRDLKSRPQTSFIFDARGAPMKVRGHEGVPLPAGKFIIHRHQPEYESPFGNPLSLQTYWAFWLKRNALKYWAVYLERFGSPTVVARYNAGNKAARDEALEVLQSYINAAGVVVPETVKLDMIEALTRGSGVQGYRAFIEQIDTWQAKKVLGGTLTSGEGRHGTQALGQIHFQLRKQLIEGDAACFMNTFRAQLFHYATLYNFGLDAARALTPTLEFDLSEQPDMAKQIMVDRILAVDMGLPLVAKDIYNKYGLRPPDPDTPTVGGPEIADILPKNDDNDRDVSQGI